MFKEIIMDTLKKLFIAAIGVLLLTLGMNNTVYASEIIYTEDAVTDDTYIQESGDSEQDENNIEQSIEYSDLEEINDPEKYELYVDEQGQIYYVEKESDDQQYIENDKTEEKDNVNETENKKESKSETRYSENDLRLLACLVYCEAGNQPYDGMLAVANVVLNRVKSKSFPHVNTIEDAIYDNKWAVQFSVTVSKSGKSIFEKALESYDTGKFPGKNPESAKKSMEMAIKAAKAALNGENNIGDYLCFRMNNSSAASIKKKYDYKIIGDHIFYRTK